MTLSRLNPYWLTIAFWAAVGGCAIGCDRSRPYPTAGSETIPASEVELPQGERSIVVRKSNPMNAGLK
jgi:hypothetical protein